MFGNFLNFSRVFKKIFIVFETSNLEIGRGTALSPMSKGRARLKLG